MFLEMHKNFKRFVQSQIPATGKKPLSEQVFDQFIATVLANDSLDVPGKIYDGHAGQINYHEPVNINHHKLHILKD